jgi:uncharacterized sulfatase
MNHLFSRIRPVGLLVLILFGAIAPVTGADEPANPKRWSVLWISAEDLSPDLGCYGDSYAKSPAIDKLAADGARWTRAFSVAPVCAPSRSSIITGMYPNSIGSLHMRNKCVPPPEVKCFTEYLRAAGFWCSNNVKTDYQFDPPATAWDESSNKAHWRNRPDPKQPFFSVFNITTTHESQIRLDDAAFASRTEALTDPERHDPAKAVLPKYYPDSPVIQRDWARYHDLITAMDKQVAAILAQLDEDGLADSTIVFFWGDHGRGLPRSKRWPYDSGTRVPLIVRWPGTIKPGTVVEDIVTLMDLGPSVMKTAGLEPPEHMQAQAFLGEVGLNSPGLKKREYAFAHRDRMDETYDMIRSARDEQFRYVRNFQHKKPYAQYIDYMEQMPTMRELRSLNKEGKLSGPSSLFFQPEKPKHELYDTLADPDEVENLADDPQYKDVVKRMKKAVDDWMEDIEDLGFLPEPSLNERFRPGGVQKVTSAVASRASTLSWRKQIALSCTTPGASIAWRYADDPKNRWRLFTGPIPMKSGIAIEAKACRIGYRDSEIAVIESN